MRLVRLLKFRNFAFASMGIITMASLAHGQIPQFDHVVVVIMENHNYGQILGPAGSAQAMAAPYLNSLAATGALFTNSHGTEHPSQPNYLDLFSGSNQGQAGTDNYPLNPSPNDPFATTATNPFTSPNLGASLFTSGFTFKTYSEDLPAVGSLVVSSGDYQHKHNPSANWQSNTPAPAIDHTLPASANVPFFTSGGNRFFGDATSSTDFSGLPTVSFVVPNQQNDMHDGTIQMGDTWLSTNIEAYRQWALTHNSLLILTFDEGSEDPNTPVDSAENRVVTIFAGQNVIPGQYAEAVTHFTILRTLEDMYGLPTSGPGDLAAASITDVFAAPPSRLYVAEYAVNNGRIFSMNLDGSNPVTVVTPPAAEWLLIGVDVDPATGKLYWSNGNFNSSTIRRADSNGANSELLLSGLKLVRGISLDTANGKFYWANSPSAGNASGLIERANLDGSGRETVYAQDPYDPVLSYVGPPTVDAVNGYVYFCADQEIRRVRLDGTGTAETVVKGVNTVVGLALDVASNHIYFIDANTNTDFLGRANLDGTDFQVLLDQTPGVSASSLMNDLKLDLARAKAYWTNNLGGNVGVVQRVGLAGGALQDVENIYIDSDGRSPTTLSFDQDPPQPILDCNHNSIRDLDDIISGASQDCNLDGIPDECEAAPCVIEQFLVDNGSVPSQGGRTLSGDPSQGFEVFQAFDVTGSGVNVNRIGLDGWTVNYHPSGFQVTLFPDDGSGTFPNESAPIQSVALQFRFSPSKTVWIYAPFQASLTQGRYWIRLTANDVNYDAVVRVGTSGPHSFSRNITTGAIVNSSFSVALRVGVPPPPVQLNSVVSEKNARRRRHIRH